ncbi:MAG: NUDIX domain-containing protein [Ruminiclostridium sp.]|nr:NUDIX domain-containing protein [Ruminiclostridium sp.]
MRFTYCPDCGKLLSHRDLGDEKNVPWCDDCNRPFFDTFYTCIIAIARCGDRYALIRQKNDDSETNTEKFICVSGYIGVCESAEAAAMREIKEELGIDAKKVTMISSYVYEKKKMLMLGFCADVEQMEFNISGELIEAHWFDKDTALEKLKNTSIGKELLLDILKREEKENG